MPPDPARPGHAPCLADCHLHFEGRLPTAEIARLASRSNHPFGDGQPFESARRNVRDAQSFLLLYAEICRLFRGPEDFVEAAIAVARSLADDGLRYAEVYVSPEICARFQLDALACVEAVDAGFAAGEAGGGARCAILLDAVRH
jgi:adenosine deaminase